jgi:hypothetical protein
LNGRLKRHGNGNDGHCEPEAEFRVDFEKQSMIDAVMSSWSRGLLASRAALSSTPLKTVASCLCR